MTKTILLTGVTAGFGTAAAQLFCQKGYHLIGTGRREDRLTALKEELGDHFIPLKMDMKDKNSIKEGLKVLKEKGLQIDVLINNAGLALGLEPAHQANFEDWEEMIQTNVLGLTFLTRQVLPDMVEHRSGQVINVGSIAGTYPYPGGNVYGATKAFVKQFSLNLRADLAGTNIRVTNLEPGLSGGTEFSVVRFKGDVEKADKVYEDAHAIQPEDIANTLLWLVEQPEHVNINRIEMMPTSQSFGPLPVYRGE